MILLPFNILFIINFIIAVLSVINIIFNFISYTKCKDNKYNKIYTSALIFNIVNIILISVLLVLFIVSNSTLTEYDDSKYWYLFGNSFILIFLLITFINSSNYLDNCKLIPNIINTNDPSTTQQTTTTTNKENFFNEIFNKYNVKPNGTLTLNIISLFLVPFMFVFSILFKTL